MDTRFLQALVVLFFVLTVFCGVSAMAGEGTDMVEELQKGVELPEVDVFETLKRLCEDEFGGVWYFDDVMECRTEPLQVYDEATRDACAELAHEYGGEYLFEESPVKCVVETIEEIDVEGFCRKLGITEMRGSRCIVVSVEEQ